MKGTQKVKAGQQRFVRLVPRSIVPQLVITVGGKAEGYWIEEIPSDFGGRGFELEKHSDGAVYHVLVGKGGRSCDCKGGTYHGRCKHADALATLIHLGHV